MPLARVFRLSAAELEIWREFFGRHGFPNDRAVWATAIGAAYVGATMGGKASAGELVPRIVGRESRPADVSAVKAWFDMRRKTEG